MKKRKARRIGTPESSQISKSKKAGFGYEMPPDFDDVVIYFNQKGQAKSSQWLLPVFSKLPVKNEDWSTYTET